MLCNSENNVQKASEQLTSCGYEKKDTTIPKMSMRKKDEAKNELKQQRDKEDQLNAVPVPPKAITPEERDACKCPDADGWRRFLYCICFPVKMKLQSLFESIAERIILMALESVDYSEDKAIQILNIVVADTKKDENDVAEGENLKQAETLNLELKGWVFRSSMHLEMLSLSGRLVVVALLDLRAIFRF